MVVRPAGPGDLDQLTRQFAQMHGLSHAACLDSQARDLGAYLVVWEGDTPVGRLFVRWRNTEAPRIVDEHPQAWFADAPSMRWPHRVWRCH
jgi:hypothetical protein